ncbi:hypothetical protein B0H15DRAFT_807718 [Mycena belliarum]|uniref:Nucleoplasmin-like domain-containing protein n=1 Tax=Mycena belliarum TaxID=1033014 RepID=A0AAD6TMZ9_9AGAR|nr:hypothetical protein B0H15DRAFT_807718 [Mycena belliae]
MSDLWSLQIKGNTSAIFAPLKTLKLSNATLGSDVVGEDGRTVVLLTHDSVASEDGCELAQSVPIFSLTPIKNEHRCLDIILIKDQNYTFKAQGPNSDDVSSTGSSASATTISSVDSIVSLKRKGSTISARDSQIEKRAKASYLFKDVRPGPESNQQAVRGSVVTVDVKATWKSLDSKKRILFKEDKVKLLLDGSKERGIYYLLVALVFPKLTLTRLEVVYRWDADRGRTPHQGAYRSGYRRYQNPHRFRLYSRSMSFFGCTVDS